MLFSKKMKLQAKGNVKNQSFTKGWLSVFAESFGLDKMKTNKDKHYTLIGYFNNDETKFNDILSGKTLDVKQVNNTCVLTDEKNKTYTKVNFEKTSAWDEFITYLVLRNQNNEVQFKEKVSYCTSVLRNKTNCIVNKKFTKLDKFVVLKEDKEVSIKDLFSIADEIDKYIYEKVKKYEKTSAKI